MVTLLAKVQLGDNRQVDRLTVEYWLDTIGDLDLPAALEALKRFRRERPGTYLEPGHLLELVGVEPVDSWRDVGAELEAQQRAEALERAGVTEAEFAAREHDRDWVLRTFPWLVQKPEIEAPQWASPEVAE